MIKNLRSLIQEKFPMDLRIQIELLSRRRDLVNKEKHEELIELLQSFNVEGVVPLGPGTNRYAFKLDGFVVKVATDHDGKIDNFKEFKMAKRLYPYVTKTYEVSENGTLLVAEYIQPFASYTEMCNHAEEIREILMKLSSVYLIGDVGVTSKNYANWGLRIGSDEPVCLDFAYVYEVSSELFICRECKTNSMLVPNKEFTELHCPTCKAKYLFENIRSRIGNDVHAHEIGDLTQEGYRLLESGVSTELDETRSNYLARRKEKIDKTSKPIEEEEIKYKPFVMSKPIQEEFKGGNTMSIFENSKKAAESVMSEASAFQFSNGMIIPVKSVAVIPADEKIKFVKAVECTDLPENEEMFSGKIDVEVETPEVDTHDVPEEGLAFSGTIDPDILAVPAFPVEEEEPQITYAKSAEVLQYPEKPASNQSRFRNPTKVETAVINNPVQVNQEKSVKPTVPEPKKLITDNFKRNAYRAFSKLSDRIGNNMHELAVKDLVSSHIRDRKMYPETFYKAIQNAVFRSLMIFCNFTEKDVPNQNGNGTRKEFTPPDTFDGTPFYRTAVFASRFWENRDINSMEDASEIMIAYRDRFADFQGIQEEWIPILEERIKQKLPIDASGARMIVEVVKSNWCSFEEITEEPQQNEEQADVSAEVVINDRPTVEEPEECEVAFSGAYDYSDTQTVEVAQNPVDTDDEYDEGETGDDEESPFYVEVTYDDEYDIIKVNSGDAFGSISIPFYTKLDKIRLDAQGEIPSIADDRNGDWDWLIHMVPDMMFRTKNPEKWLEVNNYNCETNQLRIVIMNENDGEYIMGIYYFVGIFIIDQDGQPHPTADPVLLSKINKIIRDETGYGSISHLQRSLSMKDLIRDEQYINDLVVIEEDEDADRYDDPDSDNKPGDDPEDSPETEPSEAEEAAIRSLLQGNDDLAQEATEPVVVAKPEEPEEVEEFVTEVPQHEPTPAQPDPEPITTNTPGVYKPITRRKKS